MKKANSKWWVILIVSILVSLMLGACGGEKPKSYTVGVINISANLENVVDGFKEGMTELGYVEGENISYIYAGPTTVDQLDTVAKSLVDSNVDLILSLTTPATLAVQRATANSQTPVVFIPVTDPVGANIVNSLTNPGGNITGVTYSSQEGPRLQWLLQVSPEIKQVYIVYNPDDPSPVLALESVKEAALDLGVEINARPVSTQDEISAAFDNIPEETDAILFLPDSVVNQHLTDWVQKANQLGLPSSGPNVETINDGVLTVYGVDLSIAAKKQAARLADQIFREISPADLPIEFADYYSGINLKTANAIGIDIPDNILKQADFIVR